MCPALDDDRLVCLQLHDGNVFILPSFFQMMIKLQVSFLLSKYSIICISIGSATFTLAPASISSEISHMIQEQKRKFSIVFRTFGLDGKEVAGEYVPMVQG